MSPGDPCPKCGRTTTRLPASFYWRGETRDGTHCEHCNALWPIKDEEIEPLRFWDPMPPAWMLMPSSKRQFVLATTPDLTRSLRVPDLFAAGANWELFVGKRFEVVRLSWLEFELKEIECDPPVAEAPE